MDPFLTSRQLEVIIGHFTFLALLRRPLLSLMGSVYSFCARKYVSKRLLWPSVVRELRWMQGLLPLCLCELASPMSRMVGCSDASLDGGGGCVAVIPTEEVLELSRFRERWRFKGDRALVNPRTQALAADPPGLLPSPSSGVRAVPFVGGRLLDAHWRTIFSDPWAFS